MKYGFNLFFFLPQVHRSRNVCTLNVLRIMYRLLLFFSRKNNICSGYNIWHNVMSETDRFYTLNLFYSAINFWKMKESHGIISQKLTLYSSFSWKTPKLIKWLNETVKFTVLMFLEQMSTSLSVCAQSILYVNLKAAILLVIIYIL